MNIGRIEADIVAAHIALDIARKNPFAADQAAFHVQQAVEKGLKHFLYDVHGADSSELFTLHDIGEILRRLEALEPGFGARHAEIAEAAETLSDWSGEAPETDGPRAAPEDVRRALGIAERFYEEVRVADAERNAPGNGNAGPRL